MSKYFDLCDRLHSNPEVIKDVLTSQGAEFDSTVARMVATGDSAALMAYMQRTVRDHVAGLIFDTSVDEGKSMDDAAEAIMERATNGEI